MQGQNVYLNASFRILGVPSNNDARLSGATIKTLAILKKKYHVSLLILRIDEPSNNSLQIIHLHIVP